MPVGLAAAMYTVTDLLRGTPRALGTLTKALIAALFAVTSCALVFGIPFTDNFGLHYRIDTDVYRLGAMMWRAHQPLYAVGSMQWTSEDIWLPFTYPPISAIGFVVLTWMPLLVASTFLNLVTIGLLIPVMKILLGSLTIGAGRDQWWLAVLAASGAMWLDPIWSTLGFGQINVILMILIVLDVLVIPPTSRWRGVLIGVAGALKLTPMAFLLLFVVRREWRACLTAVGAFIVVGGIGFAWAPRDSWTYWTSTVFNSQRIGNLTGPDNQNANGFWHRIFVSPDLRTVLWIVSALIILAIAVLAIDRCTRGGHHVLALGVTGLCGVLVSPTTWGHHWVWFIPTVLAMTTVAARVADIRTHRPAQWYLIAVGIGLVIFAAAPYARMSRVPGHENHWSVAEHLYGNLYLYWGVATLCLIATTIARFPVGDKPLSAQVVASDLSSANHSRSLAQLRATDPR